MQSHPHQRKIGEVKAGEWWASENTLLREKSEVFISDDLVYRRCHLIERQKAFVGICPPDFGLTSLTSFPLGISAYTKSFS